jgi:hypothetical protein
MYVSGSARYSKTPIALENGTCGESKVRAAEGMGEEKEKTRK